MDCGSITFYEKATNVFQQLIINLFFQKVFHTFIRNTDMGNQIRTLLPSIIIVPNRLPMSVLYTIAN